MKKNILITFLVAILSINLTYSQKNNLELNSKYDFQNDENQLLLERFQGIDKLKFDFNEIDKIIGKDFKIVVKTYKKGKLEKEKIVIDTKNEGLPKINKDFKFTIVTQQTLNNEKIGFFFPNFFNNQFFDVDKKYKNGTLLLRDVTGGTGKIDFELSKEIQIALITPPNDDPNKGNLGYCEVSKGNINVKEWYDKYKISQFFLIYITIEQ